MIKKYIDFKGKKRIFILFFLFLFLFTECVSIYRAIVPFREDIYPLYSDKNIDLKKYFYFSPKMIESIQLGMTEEELYSKSSDRIFYRLTFPKEIVLPKFLKENTYIPVT